MGLKSKRSLDKSASTRQAEALNTGADGLAKGAKVWVRGSGHVAWEMGELRGVENGQVQVALDRTGKVVSAVNDDVVPANPRLQEGIPDLTHLTHLNEPGILHNLNTRYAEDDIYTFAGPVLIALNPCKPLPLYTPEIANQYKAGARDVVHSSMMAPHIYLVAAHAYRRMVREKTSQSLIVNGESGAGKTETTKKAMQYFATLAGGTGVEDQVLETNPILEAFGNAKTLRNHNSSRFGKLIQIHFNQAHAISGAAIKTYLLEKSRVVHQLKGERSYHIFYQLVRGATPAQRQELWLPTDPTAFKYLSKSGCTEIEGVDDAAEFRAVCTALEDVGIDETAQDAVFRLLAGVLWLGNLEFARDTAHHDNDVTTIVKDGACEAVCDLLGVTFEGLIAGLTRKRIVTPGEVVTKVLNMGESQDCRDALAKALYAALFDWIVARINAKLDGKGRSGNSSLSIAILDIYGFEQFQSNSFEQLCINYANERLQQQFTRHLFTLEQLEYVSEDIDWTKVEFIDNYECVDAIEAAPPRGLGVLAVLDAQCKFPKATDDSFIQKLKEALGNHSHFDVNPRHPNIFTILHYAGSVGYNCAGFLDKNKDTLNADLIDLMLGANGTHSPLVPILGLQVKEDVEVLSKRGQTVGSRFSLQLKDLISELDATGLHFVRCIKPNGKLQPGHWEEGIILHQLRCCGVLEVARIARAGYPTRYTHQAFAERYAILLPRDQQGPLLAAAAQRGQNGGAESGTSSGALAACRQLLSIFGLSSSQYQVGRTKVFFRPGALGVVEDKWAAMQTNSVKIQAYWRMHSARSKYLALQQAAGLVQAGWRARADRMAYEELKRQAHAARVLQSRWRGITARNEFLRARHAAVTIQMGWRRYRFNKGVGSRVQDRRAREEAERVRQSKFETLQQQYGCDMEDVRAALAAWSAARATGGPVDSDAMAAAMAQAQQQQQPRDAARSGAGGAVVAGVAGAAVGAAGAAAAMGAMGGDRSGAPGGGASGLCRMCGKQLVGAEGGAEDAQALEQRLSAEGRSVSSPRTSGGVVSPRGKGEVSARAAAAAAEIQAARSSVAAIQEHKEAVEKLQLDNLRLQKKLALEQSLKDKYHQKYEEQNNAWMAQLGLLQEYINSVRAAFGDVKLPPLPTALASAGVTLPPRTGPTGDALSARSSADVAPAGPQPFAAQPRSVPAAVAAPPPPPAQPVPRAKGILRAQPLGAGAAGVPYADSEEEDAYEAAAAPRGAYQGSGWDRKRTAPVAPPALQVPNSQPVHMRGSNGSGLQVDVDYPRHSQELYDPDEALHDPVSDGLASPTPARPVQPLHHSTSRNSRAPAPPGLQRQPSAQARGAPAQPAGAAGKYVTQLDTELGKVQQVLDDDVDFIAEVAHGHATAPDMDPGQELARLKRKFELWRKEFKDKITTAEEVLKKLDRMAGIPGGVPARAGPSGSVYVNGMAQPVGSFAGYPVAPTPTKDKGIMGKLLGR